VSAETWVLLRGLIREHRHWEDFPRRLGAMLPGAALLTPDLPGNGRRCAEPSPWQVSGMLAALRSDLAARGVQGPVNVLALSLGGMVAFEWMSAHPGEVRRAVLLNTSLAALSPFTERLLPANYLRILRDGLFARSSLQRERFILAATTNLVADREGVAQHWARWGEQSPVSVRNAVAQLVAAARYRAPAARPACPVLLLNGGGDRLVSPRCSERIAAAWQLPLRRHPSAGHDLALDAGDWVAAEVAQFVAANP
jgi:pimeloyl-ACP methyl ester carboxylesterase